MEKCIVTEKCIKYSVRNSSIFPTRLYRLHTPPGERIFGPISKRMYAPVIESQPSCANKKLGTVEEASQELV